MFDWGQAVADLASVIEDNVTGIVIRRGGTTLPAQSVRIARVGGQARQVSSSGAQESRGRVVVLGGTGLDIQPDDRFNDAGGVLYRVVMVRPNRRAGVMAEAEAVE